MFEQFLSTSKRNVHAKTLACAFLCLNILSNVCYGAGTLAGTEIRNRASLDYTVGPNTLSTYSPEAVIKVQELINVLVQSQDAGSSVLVPVGSAQSALLFQITNNGNSDEAFTLSQSDLTGDDFDIGTNFDQLYLDTDPADGRFNSLVDTPYNNGSAPTLAPDESILIWAVSENFPTNLPANDSADIQLSALAQTFEGAASLPVIGDVISDGSAAGVDSIYGAPANNSRATGTFVIDNPAIDLSIEQEILSIVDTDGGNIARTGSEVTYQLIVTIEGVGGDATNIVISNPLPNELRLKNGDSGTITLVGSGVYTAAADGDIAEYNAVTNTINVALPDMTVVTPAVQQFIQFTTIIQ